jgi:hypothetical protein
MKIPVNSIKTESKNIIQEMSFGVSDLGMLFDILRNKMYKDPILAICREISCNARDAHREIGTPDLPIQITIPTAFDPNYKVQDFGPGISPDRMENIFCKYMASTKREDNNQQGGFGLGGKSPFSYSDTFTIITIVDKVKRIYTAYIDESGLGKVVLASQNKTVDNNGTTISIPVLREDIPKFLKRTLECTKYWKIKPLLVGREYIDTTEWQKENIQYSGTNWYKVHNNYNSHTTAIIDDILYEIDEKSLHNLPTDKKLFLQNKIFITFNIGELSLSPSRDNIHYDEKTQAIILKRIDDIYNEIITSILDKIKQADTYIQACLIAQKFCDSFYHDSINISSIKWKDQNIQYSIKLNDIGKWAKINFYQKNNSNSINKKHFRLSHLNLINNDFILYHDDTNQKFISKELVEILFDKNKNKCIGIIGTPAIPTSKKFQDLDPKPLVSYNLDLLNKVAPEKLSSFKFVKSKVVRTKNIGIANGSIVLPSKDKNLILGYEISFYKGCLKGNSVNIDKNFGGYYLLSGTKRNEFSSDGFSLYYEEYFDKAKTFLGVNEIYGFKQKDIKKLSSNWIPLKIGIENKIKSVGISEADLLEKEKCEELLYSYLFSNNNTDISSFLKKIDKDGIFFQYLTESLKIENCLKQHKLAIYFIKILTSNKNYHTKYDTKDANYSNNAFVKLISSVFKNYPMLEYLLNRSDSKINIDIISGYINLVDEKNKIEATKLLVA